MYRKISINIFLKSVFNSYYLRSLVSKSNTVTKAFDGHVNSLVSFSC